MALPGTPGQRISDLCNGNHITQKELAEKIGVSASQLSRIVSGETRTVSSDILIGVAKEFKVSTDYILGLSTVSVRKSYDISELGLSEGAVRGLVTGAVDVQILNRLLEHRNFPKLIDLIRIYFQDTAAKGITARNQLIEMATASIVAKESDMDKSVHMHTDDFFHYLSKGAIPPHLPESNEQNLVVIEAFLEAAKRYARGGYDVIVDGIVGPWFLEPWKALAQEDYEVHYIVLRASKKETMKRAVERSKLDRKTNIELVETMWEQFSGLGVYESNVIDTTTFTIKDTVSAIKERVACGTSLLS